jgi:hypothetical protein
MVIGTIQQGPYVDLEKLASYDSLDNDYRHPSAIMAAKRETLVDLKLLDGTQRQGLRLQKGVIYNLDFLQVMNSSPGLNKSELWVFYLPSNLRAVSYL